MYVYTPCWEPSTFYIIAALGPRARVKIMYLVPVCFQRPYARNGQACEYKQHYITNDSQTVLF